jgi:hypothetical protein
MYIDVYWAPQVISLSEDKSVKLIVVLNRPVTGRLNVVIMKDIPIMMDEEVYRVDFGLVTGPKTFEIVFEPPEPSSATLRGYYVKVLMDGKEVYIQEDGYPPRLRVNP